ncbi:MAG: hypothetical protein R6V02_00250 [Candidatus Aminicenantes bacterium]
MTTVQKSLSWFVVYYTHDEFIKVIKIRAKGRTAGEVSGVFVQKKGQMSYCDSKTAGHAENGRLDFQ